MDLPVARASYMSTHVLLFFTINIVLMGMASEESSAPSVDAVVPEQIAQSFSHAPDLAAVSGLKDEDDMSTGNIDKRLLPRNAAHVVTAVEEESTPSGPVPPKVTPKKVTAVGSKAALKKAEGALDSMLDKTMHASHKTGVSWFLSKSAA